MCLPNARSIIALSLEKASCLRMGTAVASRESIRVGLAPTVYRSLLSDNGQKVTLECHIDFD